MFFSAPGSLCLFNSWRFFFIQLVGQHSSEAYHVYEKYYTGIVQYLAFEKMGVAPYEDATEKTTTLKTNFNVNAPQDVENKHMLSHHRQSLYKQY